MLGLFGVNIPAEAELSLENRSETVTPCHISLRLLCKSNLIVIGLYIHLFKSGNIVHHMKNRLTNREDRWTGRETADITP